jgi:beta-lactamase class A
MLNDEIFSDKVSLMLKEHHNSGEGIVHNATLVIPSASTIKVLIMACAMERYEKQLDMKIKISKVNVVAYSLSTEMMQREYSIYDLIVLMIDVSDNSAANQLIDLLGMAAINELAQRIGLENTCLKRKMMDFESKASGFDNVTTASDLFRLAEWIRMGKLKGYEKMIEILSQNRDRSMLGRYLEEDEFLAHKTGLNSDVVIDFGFDETQTIAIAVSGDNVEVEGSNLIGKIFRHFREGG